MSIKSVKQQNCLHKFTIKGSAAAYVKECSKCGYWEVCV